MKVKSQAKLSAILTGIFAVIAGLCAGYIVSASRNGLNNPINSVGSQVINYAPQGVKEFVIKVFGTQDKLFLQILVSGFAVLFAVYIGKYFYSPKKNIALYLLGALFLIVSYGAILAPGSDISSLLPGLVSLLTAFAVLKINPFKIPLTQDPKSVPEDPRIRKTNRRELLRTSALLVAGISAAGVLGSFLNSSATRVAQTLQKVLPKIIRPLPPPPLDPALRIPGLSTLFTPNKDFYRIDLALQAPNINADTWTLKIDGMVNKPLSLTYDQLVSRGLFELDDTISCVSNEVGGELVGNARWSGVRLDELIKEVEPQRGADQVFAYAADGFTAGFPLAALDGRDAMVVLGMNGQTLPLEHGYPARIIVPGLYGYVSATKWVTRIELTTFKKSQGYWISRGWSALGPIKTQSRIDTPRSGSRITNAPFAIAGIAWAPNLGIEQVEVRINNGVWEKATLGPELANTTWRQWWVNGPTTPGEYVIAVRATDKTGFTQGEQEVSTAPNGAEGWHTINLSVTV